MMATFSERLVTPRPGPWSARVVLPGSKSLSNRALLCAALASGHSELHGMLDADDTEAMTSVALALGATVERDGDRWTVEGAGPVPPRSLDLFTRQSGVTTRFAAAVAGFVRGQHRIDADEQMRRRPMASTFDALVQIDGVAVDAVDGDRLPATITGVDVDEANLEVRGDQSSQSLSGLLIAAALAHGPVSIEVIGELVSQPYVDMTLAVMERFGVEVERRDSGWVIQPGGYGGTDFVVEPDASTASYFAAAAAVTGSKVEIAGLTRHSLQGDARFLDVLEAMGARVEWSHKGVTVQGPPQLSGIDIDMADFSDTAPTLAAIAPFTSDSVRVHGIGFVRGKESDRIAAVVTELQRLGIDAVETADGFEIEPGTLRPATVDTYDDHRLAMSFAVTGLRSPGVVISNPGCVAKTFPGFWQAFDQLGGDPDNEQPPPGTT